MPCRRATGGITDKASGAPAWNDWKLITAASTGLTFRLTMVCTADTICEAARMGSIVWCGCAPCPPLPVTSIEKRSMAAIIGPLLKPTVPAGSDGQLCRAKTRSAGKRSNRPSWIIARAPACPSSPGWK